MHSALLEEYSRNPDKLHNDIKDIQEIASELWKEINSSKWQAQMPKVLKHGLDVLDAIQKSEKEQKQVDKLLLEGQNLHQNGKTQQAIKFDKSNCVSDPVYVNKY